MRTIATRAFSALTVAALAALLFPAASHAQEKQNKGEGEQAQQAQQAQESCSAQVRPAALEVGQSAVQARLALSGDIGAIESFAAPEQSGIALADPADIPKTEMAAEKTEKNEKPSKPEPLTANAGEHPSATVWLNTEGATPGSYDVRVEGAEGTCTGSLEVQEVQEQQDQQQPEQPEAEPASGGDDGGSR